MIKLYGRYKIIIHSAFAKFSAALGLSAGILGTIFTVASYYDDLPRRVIVVDDHGAPAKNNQINTDSDEPLAPIAKLAKWGVAWNFDSIRDAIFNNSNQIISLFMDGGWKLNHGLLQKLLTDAFYPDLLKHISKNNVLWGDDAFSFKCPVPEVRIGDKKGQSDILDSAIIDARLVDAGYALGSHRTPSLPYREPRFYDQVIKYNDINRNRALVLICGDVNVIKSIDQIGDALKSGNIDYGKRKNMYDDLIRQWREARTVLAGNPPNW